MKKPTPQQFAEWMERFSSRLDGLETKDVDVRAVTCAVSESAVFRKMAQFARDQSNPSALLDAFLTGLTLDVAGVTQMNNRKAAIQAEFAELQTLLTNTRAALTADYGYEFPRW